MFEGAEAHSFFVLVLLHGRVRAVKGTPDRASCHAIYRVGGLFGIAESIGRTTCPVTAYAVLDIVMLAWSSSYWS